VGHHDKAAVPISSDISESVLIGDIPAPPTRLIVEEKEHVSSAEAKSL
jgi:hypothetical protein